MVNQLLSAEELKQQTDTPLVSTNNGVAWGYVSNWKQATSKPTKISNIPIVLDRNFSSIAGVNSPSPIQQAVSSAQSSPAVQKDFINTFASTQKTDNAKLNQQNIEPSNTSSNIDNTLNDLVADMSNVVKEGRTPDINKLKSLYPEFQQLDDSVINDLTADLGNVIREWRSVDINKLKSLYPELSNVGQTASAPQAAWEETIPYANPISPYTGKEWVASYLWWAAANIPWSARNIIAWLGNMALHPIDTIEGGLKAIAWAGTNVWIASISKVTGETEQQVKDKIYAEDNPVYRFLKDQLGIDPKQNEEVADAIGWYIANRYGWVENIKKSLKEDPAWMIWDIVSLLEWGVSMAGKAGVLDEVSKVSMLNKLSEVNPYTKVPELAVKWVSKVAGATGKWLSNLADMVLNKVTAIDKEDRDFAARNPEIVNSFVEGKRTVEDVAQQLYDKMDEAENNRQALGQEYQNLRASWQKTDTTSIISSLNQELESKKIGIGKDGELVFDKFSKFNDPQQRAIKNAWKIIQDVKQEGSLDADSILNIRQKLSDLVSWEGRPLKASAVDREAEWLIKSFRAAVDKAAKNIPWMAELDAKYWPALDEINTLRKDWFNSDWTLRDNAISKLSNLTNNANKAKLERLETLIPWITEDVRGLKVGMAIDNAMKARVAQYVQQGLITGWFMSVFANPATMLPLLAAWVLLTPKNIVKILQWAASAQEGMNSIIKKISSGTRLTPEETSKVESVIQETKSEIPQLVEQLKLDTNATKKTTVSSSKSTIPSKIGQWPQTTGKVTIKSWPKWLKVNNLTETPKEDIVSSNLATTKEVPNKDLQPLYEEARKYKSAEEFVDSLSENLAKKDIMTFDEFKKTKPSTTLEMYNKIKKEIPFMLEKEGEFIKWVNQKQLDKMVEPWNKGRHYQLKQIREQANKVVKADVNFDTPLHQEARKYKSAEEFVSNPTIQKKLLDSTKNFKSEYPELPKVKEPEIIQKKIDEYKSDYEYYKSKWQDTFAKNAKEYMEEFEAKLEQSKKEWWDFYKNRKIYTDKYWNLSQWEYQLKQIREEANKWKGNIEWSKWKQDLGKLSDWAETSLHTEARKYKSARDFMKELGMSVYRTEKTDVSYKWKSVWGDGKYFWIDKNQVKEMTVSPHSGKSTLGKVDVYVIPPNLKIKEIDIGWGAMTPKEFNNFPRGNYLKKQILDEWYDGVILKTDGDLNLGGDQLIMYKNVDQIKTESQLKQIREEANK